MASVARPCSAVKRVRPAADVLGVWLSRPFACAGDGGDAAGAIDLANGRIVGDVEVVVSVHGKAGGTHQARRGRGASIAREALLPGAGEGRDGAARVDLADG